MKFNKKKLSYQVCTRCIMDTTAADIRFDNNGICNYCSDYLKREAKTKKTQKDLDDFLSEVKKNGKNKKYDCVIGLSGGVDSTFSLLKACEHGLRPLAVHMDNGWNSELAQNNISNLVRKFNVDLITHVINWREYRNYQEAFFLANVIDVELLMDNAMLAVNYIYANKFNLKYILSGTNTSTEGFKIPHNWSWFKNDKKNIISIGKKFTNQRSKTFPMFGTYEFIYYELFKKIKWILFPDYFDYKKNEALEEIIKKCDFRPYPYKHYESVFTRFYQAYILPKKFGVDKRKIHLSNLIVSNQLSRKNALAKMQGLTYPSIEDEMKDINYFLKKMKWDNKRLEKYLNESEVKHDFYPSEKKLWYKLKYIYQIINRIKKTYL